MTTDSIYTPQKVRSYGACILTADAGEPRNMTQQLPDTAIARLARSHPLPKAAKIDHRLESLERLQKFYEKRVSIVPEIQSRMFRQFIVAIVYAIMMIKKYRSLTKELAAELEQERGAQHGTDNAG